MHAAMQLNTSRTNYIVLLYCMANCELCLFFNHQKMYFIVRIPTTVKSKNVTIILNFDDSPKLKTRKHASYTCHAHKEQRTNSVQQSHSLTIYFYIIFWSTTTRFLRREFFNTQFLFESLAFSSSLFKLGHFTSWRFFFCCDWLTELLHYLQTLKKKPLFWNHQENKQLPHRI